MMFYPRTVVKFREQLRQQARTMRSPHRRRTMVTSTTTLTLEPFLAEAAAHPSLRTAHRSGI